MRPTFQSLAVSAAVSLVFAAACSSGAAPEPTRSGREPLVANQPIDGHTLPANTVVLTYDDGPDEHTLEVAQYLAAQSVHATFFVNGKRYCKVWGADGRCAQTMDTRPCDDGGSQVSVAAPIYYPESLLDQVQALGHRIANHSEDHCHLAQDSPTDVVWEVRSTQDILDRHVADGLKLFRPPYGNWSDADGAALQTDASLNALVGPVDWAIDGQDFDCWRSGMTVEACGQRYLGKIADAGGRGIILMHDRPEWNVTYAGPLLLTQWLVPQLRALGYSIAPIESVPEIGGTPPTCQKTTTTCDLRAWGDVPDGCGGTVSCGCSTGSACQGGRCMGKSVCMQGCQDALDACMGALPASQCQTSFHQCEQRCLCQPTTCAAAGAACGTINDGCGGTPDCGSCGAGSTCSGNQCVCVPSTCGGQCGRISDGCGGTLFCGQCGCTPSCSGKRCGAGDGCGGSCVGRCGKGGYVCTDDGDGMKYCARGN